jgi:hypothetical protein
MPLTIEKINDTTFKITVAIRTTTTHTVTVTPAYWQKLTGGKVPPEKLVERSFEFLLEREPNSSILRTFDLPTIQRYFPSSRKRSAPCSISLRAHQSAAGSRPVAIVSNA